MTCARPLVSLECGYAGNAIAAELDRCCTGAASERNRRLRGEAHFTPRLMFVQPGIVYESGATLEEMVYASVISISGWISTPSGVVLTLFFFNEEECSAVCCALTFSLTHRPAISHHHLSSASALICPACIMRGSQRSAHFTHNNLISQPLAWSQN